MRTATRMFLLALLLTRFPGIARADEVSDWNKIMLDTQRASGIGGIVATRHSAIVQSAVYDAVNAIDGRYSVFAVRPATTPQGASMDAATAAAAYTVLKWLYPSPSAAAFLDGAYANFLLTIPASTSKTRGLAVGTEVANAFIALRIGDGRNAAVP